MATNNRTQTNYAYTGLKQSAVWPTVSIQARQLSTKNVIYSFQTQVIVGLPGMLQNTILKHNKLPVRKSPFVSRNT